MVENKDEDPYGVENRIFFSLHNMFLGLKMSLQVINLGFFNDTNEWMLKKGYLCQNL
jgi:hypothetical protein